MQTYTPVRASSDASHRDASDALKRLDRTLAILSTELQQLPDAPQTLLDALTGQNKPLIDQELTAFLHQLDTYWQAPSALGQSRRTLFVARLKQSLQDEVVLKAYEGNVGPNANQCLPLSDAADDEKPATAYALHVKFNDTTLVEIKGALVMSLASGRTLLALPGSGVTEYTTQQAMRDAVVGWLNDKALRRALFMNVDQRHQEDTFSIAEDPELFIEPFSASDVQLQVISENPYQHAIKRQIDKQAQDVRHLCGAGLPPQSTHHAQQLQGAIKMPGLFGPSAMLEQREQALTESKLRKGLPDWVKRASPVELKAYATRLQRYDQARDALASVLGGAESAERYATINLRARLANDLGYDLEPDNITVATQRTLPVMQVTYTVERTLTQLALYGLHPGDEQDNSAFLTRTTVSVDGNAADTAHAKLSPIYIARLIGQLKLRARFGDYQRNTYTRDAHQTLMRELLDLQIVEAAHAAKMQGHISPEDFSLIEAVSGSTPFENGESASVQHIRINGSAILGRILLFRKQNAQGRLERLIMFTSDVPRDQRLKGFNNETQLLHEVVGWTADDTMREYVLEQLSVPQRATVKATLDALKQKPFPEANFLELETLDSYDAGLHTLVNQLVDVARSSHQAHTPGWYLQASDSNRQKLLALEDAVEGALKHYHAQAHTRVEDFDDYVHRRASEKICQLLNVPTGTVNPDHIIITSPRETLTYTQMMRNGYDDSFGLLNPSADTVATFKGPEGVNLAALNPTSVAGSVRGKWLADDYTNLIKSTLLDSASPGYEYRRLASTQITQLQMQAAALRSLLKGDIDAAQYQWLEPAINQVHLSDTESRRRYPIYPLQIHVDKPFIASRLTAIDQLVIPNTALTHVETVQGCVAFLPTHNRLGALLYTPKAPDGIEFRPFATFVDSLGRAGMIDYYKDRCRINARRILSFFLNDMKEGNANKVPFLPKESIQDFAQTCFNSPIERKLRDVEDTSTSRHDMLSRVVWNSIDVIATVLTLPFPPASFAVGVALSLRDNFKALQALTGDSPEDANLLMLSSVLNMAGAGGDFSTGLKGFGGALRKLARDTKPAAQSGALKQSSAIPALKSLHPVKLEDESFLVARPNAKGQAQVYLNAGFEADDIQSTGQYALRDRSGHWQPLGHTPATAATPPNGVSADRVVNVMRKDLQRIAEGHAAGVSVGNGKCYIDMNDLMYQVNYDPVIRCWYIVDPDNPFAFFGRQPVKLNEAGQWQQIERASLRGGGNDQPGSFKLLSEEAVARETPRSDLQAYELPKNLQPHMEVLLNTVEIDPMGLALDELFEMYYAQMRETYSGLREALYRDAQVFFTQPPALPLRPSLPTIDASTTVSGFLENAFSQSNGLVLSEAPKSIASKRLLMTHMATLAEQRVEILYLPHVFTDKHLKKLAKYRAKGAKVRTGSHEIKHHLEAINNGALDNGSHEYDYYHLIKEAHRHNIEVRPMSASTSYAVESSPVAAAANDSTAAQKMSNFFGHKVISGDIAVDSSRRWVALLDQRLATTHESIPGIAQLEAAISVHIDDLPAGSATRISQETPLVDLDASSRPCDFKIEFAEGALTEPTFSTTPVISPAVSSSSSASATADSLQNTQFGYRWNEVSGWQRITPKDWVAASPATALQQSLADAVYEVPHASRDTLFDLVYFKHRGMDTQYLFADETLSTVQSQFSSLRDTLQRDAAQVLTATRPARPVIPVIEPQIATADFIERLYRQTDGMVIGEYHNSIGSKQFIIDNMPTLVQQKVKTLYLEHMLTDLHQADLDHFAETGLMSKRLLLSLETLDAGHLTDPAKVYTFERLVLKARQNGLEVRAIDCAASYHLKGLNMSRNTTRQQMMNFYASRMIRQHQRVMGNHKWVALVGNSHASSYAGTVPGLAELEGGIAVQIVDVSVGSGAGITVDAGESVRLPLSNKTEFIKGDFKVKMEVHRSPVAIRPPKPLSLDLRLPRTGMFVVEQESDAHVIIHRSRDHAIHRTPVQINAAGNVYVDRPTWNAVHLQPYDDLDELIHALEDINLTRVA